MKDEIKNIGIFTIIVILLILCIWGWWSYYNSSGDLQSTIEKLRGAELTVQRITDGVSRFTEISGISGKSYRTIQGELERSREFATGLIADINRRDREINRINERGRQDIERCIKLAQNHGKRLEEVYQGFRNLQTEGSN